MIASQETIQPAKDQVNGSTASPFDAQSNFGPVNQYLEPRSVNDVLDWSLATFGDKVAQVTSFGPTGMVILDHLAKLSPGIRVITIDTQFLFDETYALWDEVQRRYPIELDIRRPAMPPAVQAQTYGPRLWQVSPNWCCHLRKVIPLGEVLGELEAWLTGLRRDQSPTRTHLGLVGWDSKYDLVKINPLATWTRGQVWNYILEHRVPYNDLHDRGYASIGCTHCTRPTNNSMDERSGRWLGWQKTECGIHLGN